MSAGKIMLDLLRYSEVNRSVQRTCASVKRLRQKCLRLIAQN